MATIPIPFGPWQPDVQTLNNAGSTVLRNVLPASAGAFRPMKAAALLTATTISSRPRGAVTGEDSLGTANVFAASIDKLYRADPSTQRWTDVSRSAGYSTGAYERVNFIETNPFIISTNFADPPQVFNLNSATRFADLTGLVKGRYITSTRGFVVLGNTQDALDGAVRHRVRWSALENPFDWNPSVQFQSDWQDLPEGGAVTGLVGGEALYVFQQRQITKATYVGSPLIFTFDPIYSDRGCQYPESLITVGTQTFFLAHDGFYMLDGDRVTSIGDDINETFFRDADPNAWQHMSVAADPENKLIYWCYASIDQANGIPSKLLVYNYLTGKWAPCDAGPANFVFTSVSLPTTLEQLGDRYGAIENVPASLDSSQWAGGNGYLSALDNAGNVYAFTGNPLPATIETGEFPLGAMISASDETARGDRSAVMGVRPLIHGPATVTARVGSRTTPLADDVSWSAPSAMNANGVCPQRTEGRYHRIRLDVSGPWERLMGIEVDAVVTGFR